MNQMQFPTCYSMALEKCFACQQNHILPWNLQFQSEDQWWRFWKILVQKGCRAKTAKAIGALFSLGAHSCA